MVLKYHVTWNLAFFDFTEPIRNERNTRKVMVTLNEWSDETTFTNIRRLRFSDSADELRKTRPLGKAERRRREAGSGKRHAVSRPRNRKRRDGLRWNVNGESTETREQKKSQPRETRSARWARELDYRVWMVSANQKWKGKYYVKFCVVFRIFIGNKLLLDSFLRRMLFEKIGKGREEQNVNVMCTFE
ncbi:uncharacterized protein LOC125385949 [Bombus terrestris]|uniref:Uncharacterized protein LOC125385949 n=1 Tax=Bombus terrestris TaxID=30195 RepID=A0A9C6W8E1_BOMTE|nr:uncharacterized protein LOC125385949 [Bombus terrestris]